MLNTDLHRANTDKKRNKKMTKEEFLSNLKKCDQGNDIARVRVKVRVRDMINPYWLRSTYLTLTLTN
jgi:hypothetical protein